MKNRLDFGYTPSNQPFLGIKRVVPHRETYRLILGNEWFSRTKR